MNRGRRINMAIAGLLTGWLAPHRLIWGNPFTLRHYLETCTVPRGGQCAVCKSCKGLIRKDLRFPRLGT